MASPKNPGKPDEVIPLFPLPATVFYPRTLLPLHIFEPRYRQMVADALEGDRKIGMVLLKPGWEAYYYGKPDIVPVGCVGTIQRHVRLDNGKYNIALEGLNRFRIIKETGGKPYRRAEIKLLPEKNDRNLAAEKLLSACREYLDLLPEENEFKTNFDPASFQTLGQLADEIAHRFDLPVERKQALLEEQDATERAIIIHADLLVKIGLIHFSKEQSKKGFDARMN
ncbi:MAG: LON peptidase substrate-binding domain-containing protein [Nitrospinaceae bacterium]